MKSGFGAWLLFLSIIFLSGCATNPYIKKPNKLLDFRMYGFNDTKIQEDVYKVGYTGGTQETAQDMTLLRAADVTLMNGYKYFSVQQQANATQTNSSYTPLMRNEYKGKTYYTGGYTTTTDMPDVSSTIQCYKEKPADAKSTIYEALEVKTNIMAKYKITGEGQ